MEIAFLADRPDTIPTIAAWFREEWSDYYAERTEDDIARDFRREMNKGCLPIRLIALENDTLVGTVVLRETALEGYPQFTPGLGGLLVHKPFRRTGIGSCLVRACMVLAHQANLGLLYAASATAGGLLERLGWRHVETVPHKEGPIAIYRAPPAHTWLSGVSQ